MAKRNKKTKQQQSTKRYSITDCEMRPVTKRDKWCKIRVPRNGELVGEAPFGYVMTIPYLPNRNTWLEDINGRIVRCKKHCGKLLLQVIIKEVNNPQYGIASFIIKIANYLNFDTTNKVFKGSTDYRINGYEEENEAVSKIIEIANKNEKTYILAIGAITNVALAIKKAPNIIHKIEVIWLGGNSLLSGHNREFNFEQDMQAVKEVFASKVTLNLIPCKNVASNLRTSIYELEHFLKGKSKIGDYLCQRFYNDDYHGIQIRRVIWDISVIAYMINKDWFETIKISCPNIKEDTSYELTKNNHEITMVNDLQVNKIYQDLFEKLNKNITK